MSNFQQVTKGIIALTRVGGSIFPIPSGLDRADVPLPALLPFSHSLL
jgi:hypothetical protein